MSSKGIHLMRLGHLRPVPEGVARAGWAADVLSIRDEKDEDVKEDEKDVGDGVDGD